MPLINSQHSIIFLEIENINFNLDTELIIKSIIFNWIEFEN
jgi:hypothetical protein